MVILDMAIPKYFLSGLMILLFGIIFLFQLPDYNENMILAVAFVLVILSANFLIKGLDELGS